MSDEPKQSYTFFCGSGGCHAEPFDPVENEAVWEAVREMSKRHHAATGEFFSLDQSVQAKEEVEIARKRTAQMRRDVLSSDVRVTELAFALCTSSWHISIYPHADERPCAYHIQRATDSLKIVRRRRSAQQSEKETARASSPPGESVPESPKA